MYGNNLVTASVDKNAFFNNFEAKQLKLPLVIYHGNCADGFSAAWVFHHMQDKIEQSFDFHPGVYGEDPFEKLDLKDRDIYLVDFSYKRDVVEQMLVLTENNYPGISYRLTLIDHHKTAIEDLASIDHPNFRRYVDLERSGAMLAWDYWNNYGGDHPLEGRIEWKPGDVHYVAPPLLLEHVQDRDLWRFKLEGTREIQAAMFSYEYTFENWDAMMLGGVRNVLTMTIAGTAIERKHHKDIAELVKVCARLMSFEEFYDSLHESASNYAPGHLDNNSGNFLYGVPVASLPYTMSSDAGRVLIEWYDQEHAKFATSPEVKWAACYWDTPTGRTFSLRSIKDIGADVSEIAKFYGGGGHKHAAGFTVPRSHRLAQE